MALIDQVRSELKAAIGTLARRDGSSADAAEQTVILASIAELNGELASLKQATLLQAAISIAGATEALERAVAAAKLGPFNGYLTALDGHLTTFSRLSAKAHATDSLDLALVTASSAKRGKQTKKAKAGRRSANGASPIESTRFESLAPTFLSSTAFNDLAQEYQSCFDRCRPRPEYAGNIAYYVRRLQQGKPNYQLVEQQIGVPWRFVGIIHGMECGFNFAAHLHNGDKLTARTVQVPKGRPTTGEPPFTWLASALDALRLKKLDKVTDWSVPHMLYLLEAYNGLGYRKRSLPSPYLWSFSNIYDKGKFVADGRYDPNAVSKQCGAALMLKAVTYA